jgi:hypothetical protein
VSLALTLVMGVLRGLWTLEDLDTPSRGWDEIENDRRRSAVPRDTRNPHDRRMVPATNYPDAGSRHRYRNLAREWIAEHPAEWDLMLAKSLEAEPALAAPDAVAQPQ